MHWKINVKYRRCPGSVPNMCTECRWSYHQGFPLSHRWLKEHVDCICQACLGDLFPDGGVGKNWTNCFVEKHSEAIKMSWSQPLEMKRGQAVNPFTNYELLGDTVKNYDITK